MPLRALPYGYRVEICTLKEYIRRIFCNPGILATKHTGKAHRRLCVGNHKVRRTQCTLHTIQSDEFFSFLCPADNHLATFDLCCIKRMKRLSYLMKYKIGDINYIVDRSKANCKEFLLKPFR